MFINPDKFSVDYSLESQKTEVETQIPGDSPLTITRRQLLTGIACLLVTACTPKLELQSNTKGSRHENNSSALGNEKWGVKVETKGIIEIIKEAFRAREANEKELSFIWNRALEAGKDVMETPDGMVIEELKRRTIKIIENDQRLQARINNDPILTKKFEQLKKDLLDVIPHQNLISKLRNLSFDEGLFDGMQKEIEKYLQTTTDIRYFELQFRDHLDLEAKEISINKERILPHYIFLKLFDRLPSRIELIGSPPQGQEPIPGIDAVMDFSSYRKLTAISTALQLKEDDAEASVVASLTRLTPIADDRLIQELTQRNTKNLEQNRTNIQKVITEIKSIPTKTSKDGAIVFEGKRQAQLQSIDMNIHFAVEEMKSLSFFDRVNIWSETDLRKHSPSTATFIDQALRIIDSADSSTLTESQKENLRSDIKTMLQDFFERNSSLPGAIFSSLFGGLSFIPF